MIPFLLFLSHIRVNLVECMSLRWVYFVSRNYIEEVYIVASFDSDGVFCMVYDYGGGVQYNF